MQESQNIHLLPEHIIDQIKAGEVVEKPANVLKELLENSIDAGATEVKVTIYNNGLDLINIEDNGTGISFADLPFAFCRHATSKITSFEDIYQLNTFGFRGEALASISSIARVSCHSIPKGDLENGGKIVVHGAETIEHSPYRASEYGTSIFVRDLFYNTPVRLKFVRSRISEKNALKRIINAFLLANPSIKFSVQFDEDDKEIYRPIVDGKIDNRIIDVFFKNKKNINKSLYFEEKSYLGATVSCHLSHHSTKGNTGKQQFLFVNNRLFIDKKIHQIVIRNMEALWGFGTTGHYYINIRVPENELDVNVHPNKILVKFLNESEVFSLISSTIKEIKNNFQDFSSNEQIEHNLDRPIHGESLSSNQIWQSLNRDNDSIDLFKEESRPIEPIINSFGQSALFESQDQYTLQHIEGQIYFLQLNESIKTNYFLNINPILNFELLSLLQKKYPQVVPLLISEPYKCSIFANENRFFAEMEEIGFECDRLDEETIVLRSIPSVFEETPYIQVFSDILENEINNPNTDQVNFSSVNLSTVKISQFIDKIGIPKLIEIKSLKSLTEKKIVKKFYAN